MKQLQPTRSPSRPRVAIAGPPRGRHALVPPEPTVVVPADVVMASAAAAAAVSALAPAPGPAPAPTPTRAPTPAPGLTPSPRPLPPLDYDEWTRASAPGPRFEQTRPSLRMRRSRRPMWFAIGLALGVVTAAILHDDAVAAFHDARVYCAHRLRSLESPHGVPATNAPSVSMGVSPSPLPAATYATSPSVAMVVPTVRAEDLPRVKPPVVYRPRPRVAAPTAPTPADIDVDINAEIVPLPGADDPPSS